MGILHQYCLEYIINMPKNKLKYLNRLLNKKRKEKIIISEKPYYRGRQQAFYWVNHIEYGYDWELNLNLVACLERREEVDKSTEKIIVKYSEHRWISSIPFAVNNLYELCNLGARKKRIY